MQLYNKALVMKYILSMLLALNITGITAQIIEHKYNSEGSFSISNPRTNRFYVGMTNPVDISVDGVCDDKVFIKMSHGKLTRYDNSFEYTAQFFEPGPVDIEILTVDDKGDTSSLGSQRFGVYRFPKPIAYISGITGYGRVSKAQLKATTKIHPREEYFQIQMTFHVKSFKATIPGCEESTYEEVVEGGKFSDALKSQIERMEKGDHIVFSDIVVAMPGPKEISGDQNTASLAPVIIEIE